MISIGGIFVTDATPAQFPLIVREIISQPLLDGPVLLVLAHLLINHVVRPRLSESQRSGSQPREVAVAAPTPEATV